jgi:hypothetical protein
MIHIHLHKTCDAAQKWAVLCHMTDPHQVGIFNQSQKTVNTTAASAEEAMEKATAFYKKRGYRKVKPVHAKPIGGA